MDAERRLPVFMNVRTDFDPEIFENTYRVGVISDTHGILRPDVPEALAGVDLIIHAGDVGRPEVLDMLGDIAPVVAVKGNVDQREWALGLREREVVELGEICLYVLHDLNRLDLDPVAAGFKGIIYGHSHRPSKEWREGVLYLNPGSAGPTRFVLPVSLAILQVRGEALDVRFITLDQEKGHP